MIFRFWNESFGHWSQRLVASCFRCEYTWQKIISQVQKCFLCHVTPSSLASIGVSTWAEGEAGSTSAIESGDGKCLQVLCWRLWLFIGGQGRCVYRGQPCLIGWNETTARRCSGELILPRGTVNILYSWSSPPKKEFLVLWSKEHRKYSWNEGTSFKFTQASPC